MLKAFLKYGIWLAHLVHGFEYHDADFYQAKNVMCTACSIDNLNLMCKEASVDFYCTYPKVLHEEDRALLYFTTSNTNLNMKKICRQNVREAFDSVEHILTYTLVDQSDKICENYDFTESYVLLGKTAELPIEAPMEPVLETPSPPPPPSDSPIEDDDEDHNEVNIEEPVEAPKEMPDIDVWIYFEASFKINVLCSELYYSDIYTISTLSADAIQEAFQAFSIITPSCKNSNFRMLLEDTLSSDMSIAYKYGVTEIESVNAIIALQDKIQYGDAEAAIKNEFKQVLPAVSPSNFTFTEVYILYENGTMISVSKYSPPPAQLYYPPPPSIVLKTISKKSMFSESTVIGLSIGLGICGTLLVGAIILQLRKKLKPSNTYKPTTLIEISN